MADRARVHVVVRGRVQGVAFRAYTVDEARALGVRLVGAAELLERRRG